jgi:uncharacterized protein
MLGLGSCARPTVSTAPLSAGREPQPAATAAGARPASPANTAKPKRQAPGKQGKRALYARACDLGSAVGCNDLAILLGSADAQALPLLERACSLGLTRGCANLGTELLRQEPADAERARAVKLLQNACEQNDAYGCAELADALYAEQQRGQKSEFGRAYAAYEKACKLGNLPACYGQGWMLKNGEGTQQDPTRARELFRFACSQDNYDGCAALGFDLLEGAQNREEFDEGLRFCRLACEHDQALGCYTLGRVHAVSSEPGVRTGAVALLKRACTLGYADSCKQAATLEERLKHPVDDDSAADAEEDGD